MKLVIEDYLTGVRKDFGSCQNEDRALEIMRSYLSGVGLNSRELVPKVRDETSTEYYFGTDTKVFVLEK